VNSARPLPTMQPNGESCVLRALQRWKRAGATLERKGAIDLRQLGFAQFEVTRPCIRGGVLGVGSFRDGEERGFADQEPQRNLVDARAMRIGDVLEDASAAGTLTRQATVAAEGTVGHHRHTVSFAPWQHGMLDGALLQVIEDLVAGGVVLARNGADLLEVGYIEVAHTPGANLPVPPQLFETGNGVLEGIAAAPVQQKTIEVVRFQTYQAMARPTSSSA